MNLSFTHKVLSITLSLLVLFSTFSYTVEKHFCGDSLVDIAVFSDAKKCGGINADDVTYIKKSCCKDTIDIIKGQDELNTAELQKIDNALKFTLFAYTYSYANLFVGLPKEIISSEAYSPPKLVKDIQVLDETYLI